VTLGSAAASSGHHRRERLFARNRSEAGGIVQLQRSGHALMLVDAFKIVNIPQFTDGISLAAASRSAAAAEDAEDADSAVGDAPACPLCLSSRKQVAFLTFFCFTLLLKEISSSS
jgi:hypothetical protein